MFAPPVVTTTAKPKARSTASSAGKPALSTCRADAIQSRLKVGAPNDPLEQEADRVADQVLRRKPTTVPKPAIRTEATAGHAPIGSSGQPLEASVRTYFEPRFRHDFRAVRIHREETGASADRMNARAYTVGRDIVFAAGMYRPWSAEGRRLLAHELAHVVQQEDLSPRIQRQPKDSAEQPAEPDEPLDDALERQDRLDQIEEVNRQRESELDPIVEKLAEQQEEEDPFFVKDDPKLRELKAQLAEEKKQLPAELSGKQKELNTAEKDFLKADDRRYDLEDEQKWFAEEREAYERRMLLLGSLLEVLENGTARAKDTAAKNVQEKLAAIQTIKMYMDEKKEYIQSKERFLQRMREHLKLRGLSAARRAGASTEMELSGEPGALLQTMTLLQTMIEASRLLAPYISGKRTTNLRVPEKFKLDNRSDFETAKHAAKIAPAERGTGTVGGFYDRATDTIHLPQTAHLGEALHEAIHKYSVLSFCHDLNEGITQYIADAVLQEQGLPKAERPEYKAFVDCATKLIHEFGFDAVAGRYFLRKVGVKGLDEAANRCDKYC